MNIDPAIDTSLSVDIAKRLRLRADHWEIDHTYTASISDPKWDREAADEIWELRNRIAQLEQALDAVGYFKAITAIMEQPK